MKSLFSARRNLFAILTVAFCALSVFFGGQTICGSPLDSVGERVLARCVLVLPFAVPALLFAWRCAVWHKQAKLAIF